MPSRILIFAIFKMAAQISAALIFSLLNSNSRYWLSSQILYPSRPCNPGAKIPPERFFLPNTCVCIFVLVRQIRSARACRCNFFLLRSVQFCCTPTRLTYTPVRPQILVPNLTLQDDSQSICMFAYLHCS